MLLFSVIILGVGSANERGCYKVTSSVIGWAHTQNDLLFHTVSFLLTFPEGVDFQFNLGVHEGHTGTDPHTLLAR